MKAPARRSKLLQWKKFWGVTSIPAAAAIIPITKGLSSFISDANKLLFLTF